VLPQEYRQASRSELDRRIRAAKAALGERVVILGHFYQRDEVVQHADFVGDWSFYIWLGDFSLNQLSKQV
jgi:quinolinate synthase